MDEQKDPILTDEEIGENLEPSTAVDESADTVDASDEEL